MSELDFNMYKNIVNNYFRTETFEKAKEFCARDMVQLNQRYITEAVCRNETLNRADKLQQENEKLKEENFDQVYMKAIADYKEKIRDKIKEYNEQREKAETKEINDMFVNYIDVLNELLGESNE